MKINWHDNEPGPRVKTLINSLQRVFIGAAILAIGTVLYRNQTEIAGLFQSTNWQAIALSTAILSLLHLAVVVGFHWAHQAIGVRRPLGDDMIAYFARLPARYLPGGIWHTAARYADIHLKSKVSRQVLLQIFMIETGLVVASGFIVAGVSSLIIFPDSSLAKYLGAGMIAFALLLMAALYMVCRSMSLRLVSRQGGFALVVLGGNWLGLGIAFAVYAGSLSASAFAGCSIPILAASYQTAASLGYVAIFAPQGWGVTEFVFGSLRACNAQLAIGVAAIAGFRLVILLADIVAYGVFMMGRLAVRRNIR